MGEVLAVLDVFLPRNVTWILGHHWVTSDKLQPVSKVLTAFLPWNVTWIFDHHWAPPDQLQPAVILDKYEIEGWPQYWDLLSAQKWIFEFYF